jgi:hypothetical protein
VRKMKTYNRGWKNESERHSLAARKVKTGHKPKCFVAGILPAEAKKSFDFERKSQVGKFDDNVAERIYQDSLDGTDDQLGDVENFGWYGLVKYGDEAPIRVKERDGEISNITAAIVEVDDQGFVSVHEYSSNEDVGREWKKVQEDYEEYLAKSPSGEGD